MKILRIHNVDIIQHIRALHNIVMQQRTSTRQLCNLINKLQQLICTSTTNMQLYNKHCPLLELRCVWAHVMSEPCPLCVQQKIINKIEMRHTECLHISRMFETCLSQTHVRDQYWN